MSRDSNSMGIHDPMSTFSIIYQKSLQKWKSFLWIPYIAFITAFMVTITILTILPTILSPQLRINSPFIFVLIYVVLPVFSGNVALFLCSDIKRTFVPSLTIRYIGLAIVMFGYYQVKKQAWNPTSNPEYVGLVDVTFMSIFGAQCFVLLVSEPILRRLLRKRANEGTQNLGADKEE